MEIPRIYVFGANEQGIHGKGTARVALDRWDAVWGQGEGLQGRAYGIPTRTFRGRHIRSLPLPTIQQYVMTFLDFARTRYLWNFELTAIGCGNAGYTPDDIAPMFVAAPSNVLMPKEFQAVLKNKFEIDFTGDGSAVQVSVTGRPHNR